jgi:glycosyltransferase involved in cell wall biosynthesis
VRILHVIQEAQGGGAERVVATLARVRAAQGHDVATAAASAAAAPSLEGARFELPVIARRPRRIPAAARRLRHAVREWRPDIVHCHNPVMGAVAALVTRRGHRPPTLVTVHGVPEGDYRSAAWILRVAGLPNVACGPGVAAALERHGCHTLRTVVNGIGPQPAAAHRRELMDGWSISDRLRLVVAVGRLTEQKNHDIAIRALTGLPDVALVILGDGPRRSHLDALAHATGVADRLVMPGWRSDVRSVLATADAVVLPSRWEGLPLVALEVWAAGVPLVACAARGIRELVHDGVDCLLVPQDDPSTLAAALRRVLDDRRLAAGLVTAGRRSVAPYSDARMAAEYESLYLRLLRSRRPV